MYRHSFRAPSFARSVLGVARQGHMRDAGSLARKVNFNGLDLACRDEWLAFLPVKECAGRAEWLGAARP